MALITFDIAVRPQRRHSSMNICLRLGVYIGLIEASEIMKYILTDHHVPDIIMPYSLYWIKMKTKLREIANIQIGYQHRDKFQSISALDSGSQRIIQIKDFAHGEFRGGIGPNIFLENLYRITPPGDAERYQVKQGDVLFLSRGQRAVAAPILDPLDRTLASYYFYILRPDAERVTAEYLAWFINQPTAQSYLERHQLGSHIKMVPKASFEELEITVPPVATQRAIVQLERIRQSEERAMARLADARRLLITGLALKAAEKAASNRRTP